MLARDRFALFVAVGLVTACDYTPPDPSTPDAGDDAPTVAFELASTNADERSGQVAVKLVLSHASERAVTVTLQTAGSATLDDDYMVASTMVTIPPNATSADFAITIVDDSATGVNESTETIDVTLVSATNAALGERTLHTVMIADRILPRVNFALAQTTSVEDTPSMVVLTLDAPSQGTSTIEIAIAGSSTANGQDAAVTTGTIVTFADGTTQAMIAIGEIDDDLDEEDFEQLDLVLATPSPNLIIGTTQPTAAHRIQDDDDLPTVGFSVTTNSQNEASGTVAIEVRLNTLSGRNVSVSFALGGTANDPADYTLNVAPGTITIPAGSLSTTILATFESDVLDENNEDIDVTLSMPQNAELAAAAHQLTIVDDDSPPTISFMATAATQTEQGVAVEGVLVLTAPSGLTVTAPFTTGGSANDPDDFELISSAPVVFAPGVTMLPITISVAEDILHEPDETVVLTLQNPNNAVRGAQFVFTLTIANDDAASVVQFDPNQSDGEANEGDSGSANFDYRIQLDKPSGFTISVTVDLTGDAVVGADYTTNPAANTTVPPTVTVTFNPGQTARNLRVTVTGDNTGTPQDGGGSDDVLMTITTAANATVGANIERRHRILNDD